MLGQDVLFIQLTFLSAYYVPSNKYDLAIAPALKHLSQREKDTNRKLIGNIISSLDAECCAPEQAIGNVEI